MTAPDTNDPAVPVHLQRICGECGDLLDSLNITAHGERHGWLSPNDWVFTDWPDGETLYIDPTAAAPEGGTDDR